MARFAQENPFVGHVEFIRKDGKYFKRLDMTRDEVREKISEAKTPAELDNIFNEFGLVR